MGGPVVRADLGCRFGEAPPDSVSRVTGVRATDLPMAPRAQSASRLVGVAIAAGTLGLIVGLATVVAWNAEDDDPGLPYVSLYDEPANGFEAKLNRGDGQAFAALAQDPLLERPEAFRAGEAEAAYRAQRPILGWLAWAFSFGHAPLVPLSLFGLSVAGLALLAVVVASLLMQHGASAAWSMLVVSSPGALITLDWTGPECLGLAAALVGFRCWLDERRAPAIVAFAVAGLSRESLLLVPIALAAHALIVRRAGFRSVLPLALPLVSYAAWVGVVWARLGALPSDAGQGRLAAPLTGLWRAAAGWSATDAVVAGLLIGMGIGSIVVARAGAASWVAASFALSSLVFGSEVWRRVEDFGRILLPIVAFGALALAPWYEQRRRRVSPDASG